MDAFTDRLVDLPGRAPWLADRNLGLFLGALATCALAWGSLALWAAHPAWLLAPALPFAAWVVARLRFRQRFGGSPRPVLLRYAQGGAETAFAVDRQVVVAGPDHLRALLPTCGGELQSYWSHDLLWVHDPYAVEPDLRPLFARHAEASPLRALRARGALLELDFVRGARPREVLARSREVARRLADPPPASELLGLELPGWRAEPAGWSRGGLRLRFRPHGAHLVRLVLSAEAPLSLSAVRRPEGLEGETPTHNVVVDNLVAVRARDPSRLREALEDEELVGALLEVVHGERGRLDGSGARLSLSVPPHGVQEEWSRLGPRIEALAGQLERLCRDLSAPR